jgi:uncharacterized protein YmfQ (DUF2313 family)
MAVKQVVFVNTDIKTSTDIKTTSLSGANDIATNADIFITTEGGQANYNNYLINFEIYAKNIGVEASATLKTAIEHLLDDLLRYLPKYERNSRVIKEILFSAAKELFNTQKNMEDLQQQFFVVTATWGLDIWEEMLGLQKVELLEEERRQRIFNKLLSNTIATKYFVEKYLKNIIGKDIEVYEDFDNYSLLIPNWEDGIPTNILQIVYPLREFIPAHLKLIFEYRTWGWLDSKNWTWEYFDSLNLTWKKFEEVDEVG